MSELLDSIMEVPALFKILILFAGIVVLYRLKVPLWLVLIAVTAATGLWFGATPVEILETTAKSAVSAGTLFLCAVVVLILGFSNLMNETGVLKRIVDAFGGLLGRSMYSVAALPALIGLLPMPGGAIFSAPMVEAACGADGGQSPEQKSAVNYWFRHIWEYWWPLYPGVILASYLFGISMWHMVLLHLPLTLAAVAAGYLFILRPSFRGEAARAPAGNGKPTGSLGTVLRESASIIVVIATIFIAGPALSAAGAGGIAAKYWPVIFGFVLGAVWLAASGKVGAGRALKTMLTKNQLSMLLLVAGVMVFRDMLVAMDAFAGAKADLETYRVPPLVVIAALPFISGIVMGLAIGFVGASFPLVLSLMPESAAGTELRFAYLALAYSFGYMGMMLSPVHFCLIMTKDYFKADFLGIYRWLLPPSIAVISAGVLLFFLYLTIFH
ncbi:MAG: DUF401 family protein [bacterium]